MIQKRTLRDEAYTDPNGVVVVTSTDDLWLSSEYKYEVGQKVKTAEGIHKITKDMETKRRDNEHNYIVIKTD